MLQQASVSYRLSEFDSFEADMTRLLQQFMGAKKPFHAFTESAWRPPTDIYETAEELVVTIEIAGVDKQAIALEFEQNVLKVRGTRKHNPTSLQVSYHQMEIKFGAFEVQLRLPGGFDADHTRARYSDGFLTVTVPRKVDGPKGIDIAEEE